MLCNARSPPPRVAPRLRRARFGRRAGADPSPRAGTRGCPAPAPAPDYTLHRQRRPLQPIRLPRHRADRRQARGAGRLRLGRIRAASTSAPGRRTSAGSRTSAPYTRSSLEWDFYGGYKNTFPGSEDWGYDVGTLYYYYPGSRNPGVRQRQHLRSLRRAHWKWLGAKCSVQPRQLLRREADRAEDRRHLVHRLLRQLSDRRIRLHDPRALRDPQRRTRRQRQQQGRVQRLEGRRSRTRCRTGC